MKFLAIFLTIFIAGCSASQQVKNDEKDCELPELTGVSCVKPNFEEIAKHPLGSRGNPIRADGPGGQREYLSKLICTNGEPVSDFSRVGSVGIGPYGFMLDLYIVICDTNQGVVEHSVFMDLYHKGYKEKLPADGFGGIKNSI